MSKLNRVTKWKLLPWSYCSCSLWIIFITRRFLRHLIMTALSNSTMISLLFNLIWYVKNPVFLRVCTYSRGYATSVVEFGYIVELLSLSVSPSGGRSPCFPWCFGTVFFLIIFLKPSLYFLFCWYSISNSCAWNRGFLISYKNSRLPYSSKIFYAIFKFSLSILSYSSFLAPRCRLLDRLSGWNCAVEWLLGNKF